MTVHFHASPNPDNCTGAVPHSWAACEGLLHPGVPKSGEISCYVNEVTCPECLELAPEIIAQQLVRGEAS